jgi:hypothetical protein
MVLLQVVISIAVRAMGHGLAQLRLDGARIWAMPIGRDSVGHPTSDGPSSTEERLGCRLILSLAE